MTRPLDDSEPSLAPEDIPTVPVPVLDGDQPTGQYVAFTLQEDGFVLATDMPEGYQPAPEVNPR